MLYFGTHRAQKEDHLFGLTHIYLSDIYELIIQSSLLLPLLGRWLANKLTVLLRGCWNCLTQPLYCHTVHTKHVYDFMTLYRCYVLCLLGRRTLSQTLYIYSMSVQCWASVADVSLALKQHWINVPFKWYLVISLMAILLPSICTK